VVTFNRSGLQVLFRAAIGEKQLIILALMVPLGVVVLAVFGQNSRERTFTEQNHL